MLPAKEPFKVLVPVGVVMGETFVTKSGKYIGADQVEEGTRIENKNKQTNQSSRLYV